MNQRWIKGLPGAKKNYGWFSASRNRTKFCSIIIRHGCEPNLFRSEFQHDSILCKRKVTSKLFGHCQLDIVHVSISIFLLNFNFLVKYFLFEICIIDIKMMGTIGIDLFWLWFKKSKSKTITVNTRKKWYYWMKQKIWLK